jgi:putative tricarboxylic transport membrane protein
LLASQGGFSVFWSSGLVTAIMTLGLIALFWSVIQNTWVRLFGRKGALRAAE